MKSFGVESVHGEGYRRLLMETALVLASASPYRKQQMKAFGFDFVSRTARIDEEAEKKKGLSAQDLAQKLARMKADDVAQGFSETSIVIGSDQVLESEGKIFSKAGNLEEAQTTLQSLSGRPHHLITALCVKKGPKYLEGWDSSRLVMRELSPDEIQRYIDCEPAFDCVGAYKIESKGLALMESIQTQDPSAIQGLPMILLCRFLREWGLKIP